VREIWKDVGVSVASGHYGELSRPDEATISLRILGSHFTKAKTKREAVVKVLEEFNRRRRMAELVKYSGTFSDSFPTNDQIEAADAERDRRLQPRSRR
jgi:hypothetical protein